MLDKIDAFGCDRFLHRNEKFPTLVSVGLEATTPAGDHDAAIAAAEHRLRALQQLPPSTPAPTIPDTHPMPRRFDRQDHPQHQYTEEPSAHHKGKLDGAI